MCRRGFALACGAGRGQDCRESTECFGCSLSEGKNKKNENCQTQKGALFFSLANHSAYSPFPGGYEFGGDAGASYSGADPMVTSPAVAQREKKQRKPQEDQFLLPITIRQAINSVTPEGQCLVAGRDPHNVKIVACVKEADFDGSTFVSWVVEDGTGLIEVKEWTHEQDSDHKVCSLLCSLMYNLFVFIFIFLFFT